MSVPEAVAATRARRTVDRSGLLAALLLGIAMGGLGWLRHRNFWSGAFDLGIFDQAAWQLSRGHAYVSLVDRNIFADHLSPVLVLFAPLYRLAATPLWLIGGQAVALGLTVLPLRALARDVGVAPWKATALVCASAPLWSAAVFDFHPSTLAVPFVALLVLHATRDNLAWSATAAAGVFLCRADLSLIIVAAAVIAGRRTRVPLAVAGLTGAVGGAAVVGWLGGTSGWALHYERLGSGPIDALAHPWRAAAALVAIGSLRPLLTWIVAAGSLVVVRPRWLGALVIGGLPVLLSGWGATDVPWFHYGAPLAPIAIGGTVAALDPRLPRWPSFDRLRSVSVVGTVLAALLSASPLALDTPDQFRVWDVIWPAPGRDSAAAIAFVHGDDVVSADNQLVAHLAHRPVILMFPLPFESPTGFLQGGALPDLSRYPEGLVDVVVAPSGTTIDGYETVGRVEGFVILRRTTRRT